MPDYLESYKNGLGHAPTPAFCITTRKTEQG